MELRLEAALFFKKQKNKRQKLKLNFQIKKISIFKFKNFNLFNKLQLKKLSKIKTKKSFIMKKIIIENRKS